MNEIFAINLINAVAGKKVNVELDKDFLNLLDLSFSERMKGMERTVLRIRFGQDRIVSTPSIASQLGISKDRAKELIDSGIKYAKSSLNLSYFCNDAETQRNLCEYFRELLEPVKAYCEQISLRTARLRKVTSFNLDENDPFSTGTVPDVKRTSYYVALIDRLCSEDIANCPAERLGCLCFLLAEAERMKSTYLPFLINREINCAKAERRAKLNSWHTHSFTPGELELKLATVGNLGELCSNAEFVSEMSVKDVLAYEAAELAPKIGNDKVKAIQKALIVLSSGIWKGWNEFWERYYSWEKDSK